MQPAWLAAMLAVFGLGFIMGYFVRALISRWRRRRASWPSRHAGELQVTWLEPPSAPTMPDSSDNALRRTVDAPAILGVDAQLDAPEKPAVGTALVKAG